MTIRFDDALPQFVGALAGWLDAEALRSGVVVRDVLGRLAFTTRDAIEDEDLTRLEAEVRRAVGAYARPRGAVASGVLEDGVIAAILDDPAAIPWFVREWEVRLIDRRLSGGDWLTPASPNADGSGPPVVVFASMKGGVGRTTSLVVSALDLTDSGHRVLVLDLDLEAPGLGVMLLDDDERPEFGALDALVERKIGLLDDLLVADLVAPSPLGGGGLLVCPALGRRSVANPANVLSKIGRVYGEASTPEGAAVTVMGQVAELVQALARVHKPDAILVDARAGLHELTAAAILGLGSEVLLFGLDEPQTWHAYRILLAQLAAASPDRSWSDALTAVQGRAPVSADARDAFRARWRAMVNEAQSNAAGAAAAAPETSSNRALPSDEYEWMDNSSALESVDELTVLAVLHDPRFVGFSPLENDDHVHAGLRAATFGELVRHVRNVVGVA
jgi:MinD-like ATPase involved in chromosome partitioning or flagellar assembly